MEADPTGRIMLTKLSTSIGASARTARTRAKLTQAEVAEEVGIATEFYARIERGHTMPSVPTLVRLADVLGLSTDELLGRTDRVNPAAPAQLPSSDAERALDRKLRVVLRRLRNASPSTIRLVNLFLAAIGEAERARPRRKSRRSQP